MNGLAGGNGTERFERTKGDWGFSIVLLVGSLVFFLVYYPKGGFVIGDKGIIYLNCFILAMFGFGFYRVFLRPYALRFSPEGMLLVKSVLFPKSIPTAWIESVLIPEAPGGKAGVYILQTKGGDPLEVPVLGSMSGFLANLQALQPQVKIEDGRAKSSQGTDPNEG